MPDKSGFWSSIGGLLVGLATLLGAVLALLTYLDNSERWPNPIGTSVNRIVRPDDGTTTTTVEEPEFEPTVVPNVIGLAPREAQGALADAYLMAQFEGGDPETCSSVGGQSPAAGETVPRDSVVTLALADCVAVD